MSIIATIALAGEDETPVFTYTAHAGKVDMEFVETDTPPITIGTTQAVTILLDNEKSLHLIGYASDLGQALAVIGLDMTRHADVMVDMF